MHLQGTCVLMEGRIRRNCDVTWKCPPCNKQVGGTGKRQGKSTSRKRQQALARIQAAVRKMKPQPNPVQGFFNIPLCVAATA